MDLREATKRYRQAQGGMEELNRGFLSKMADSLIGILKQEDRTPVDTGELKKSWYRGMVRKENEIFIVRVLNIKDYASFVEDGHRQSKRFLPGEMKGEKFHYNPDAKGGIMLSDKWIDGVHMYKISAAELEERMPTAYHELFKSYMASFGLG